MLSPLELVYDAEPAPRLDLPEQLQALYGGHIGFDRPSVFANFVSSLDGVVAIPAETQSATMISDHNEADRFVMGLLRACADVVLIGSGTMKASPGSLWTPERVYPPAAAAYADLRRRLGVAPRPLLAILTSGSIDVRHPALEAGALVLTTERGAAQLDGRLPSASESIPLNGEGVVDPRAAIALLHARGNALVLSEAGPRVTGSLLAASLLDELFLTLSPVLAGRAPTNDRPGLVQGPELLPVTRVAGRLTSVRRDQHHLFLRYEIG